MQFSRSFDCGKFALLLCMAASVMLAPPTTRAAETKSVTVKEFREAIAKRDKIIIDLLRRVKGLEARLSDGGTASSAKGSAPDPSHAAQVKSAPPASRTARQKSAPGQLVVDELTAQRALERSLVQSGALLLAPGQAELSPSFTFQHNNVSDTAAVSGFVANRSVERDTFDAALGFRHGLPWDAQFEMSVPYRFVARDETTTIVGSNLLASGDSNGHGIGDIRIGMAKTLLRAGNGWPDLVGRFTWDTGTGRPTDDGVALGFGFDELGGQLTALWRQDPMVFIATGGYEYAFEKDGLRPGQEYRLFLGTNLAVSPETSLSFGLDQVYRSDIDANGSRIDGTDQLASSFTFGTSMIVGPLTLLQLNAGIGLTDDAADYSFGMSLPIRLQSPLE
jgi:hypothetical protein